MLLLDGNLFEHFQLMRDIITSSQLRIDNQLQNKFHESIS